MSQTTSSSTRRLYKVKVKTKRGPRELQPSRPDAGGAKRIPLPPLFQRASTQAVTPATRLPRSMNRQWAGPASLLVAALFAAIYFLAGNGTPAERHFRAKQPAREPLPFNMRPMRLASTQRPTPGTATQASDASARAQGAGDPSNGVRPARGSSAAIDGDRSAPVNAAGKLVLPSEISGACNIGSQGGTDLRACLVLNGALAE